MNDTLRCSGIPFWVKIPNSNDTAVFINDVAITIVNAPFSVWAFAANLAIVIAVAKTPSLRIRSNVLLCSLATADCLTGLIAQPAFITWRLALHSIDDCQVLWNLAHIDEISFFALTATSYMMLIPISCDRLYALARPMQYRPVATETKGAILTSVAVWVLMVAYSLITLVVPTFVLSLIDIALVGMVAVVPISLHIAMFICVRRHNRAILDQNNPSSQQLSACLQREKRVARSMAVITLILLILLLPTPVMLLIDFPLTIEMIFPWTNTLSMLTSSLNPVIYLWRDGNLRSAVKSCSM